LQAPLYSLVTFTDVLPACMVEVRLVYGKVRLLVCKVGITSS
jgi:hypothetical protein